jgi:hypothetical protein
VANLRPILDQLEEAGIIIEVSNNSTPSRSGLFLARDSSQLTAAEVFEGFGQIPENIRGDERICAVLKTLAAAERENLSGLTVKDLVLGRFGQQHEIKSDSAEIDR